MSLSISIPTVEMGEPSPCGGDRMSRPLPSREDILRELGRKITASYEVFVLRKTGLDELIVRLLWDTFSDPYSMDSTERHTFLQSKPEYVSAKAGVDAARVVFHDAVATRDFYMST